MFRKIISKRSPSSNGECETDASLRSFVNCRYVLDLHKFSEWPNVKDYRVDQRLVAKTQIRFARRQEKLSRPIKIRLSRKNRTYRILEISGGPSTIWITTIWTRLPQRIRRRRRRKMRKMRKDETPKTTSKRDSSSSETLSELQEDVARPKKQQRRNETILFVSDENGERWNETIENETKSSDSAVSLNTTDSSWFDKEKIHFKERLELPEWFDGTPCSSAKRENQSCRSLNISLTSHHIHNETNPSSSSNTGTCTSRTPQLYRIQMR